ncbi:type II secretion system minor pseudopilin GspJ [Psychrobacter sp. 1U2]|uniref:type II secretion system minor pseudopilin GspJ n=1 Tax=Psychrobacter sp. 1U2 TaxID=3453577 RepID=UPI003F487D49
MSAQRGFTLLELMVAMAIFAMLAVAGWQVFDSVNRARDRAQLQADHLAALQYAYLQLQQDMGQIIAYQVPSAQAANEINNNDTSNNTGDAAPLAPEPFMRLDGEQVSFVRFADPDPRYQSSPSLQHIEYIFADQRLIRRQYTHIENTSGSNSQNVSLDSVLLEGVTAASWQALLPEPANTFPNDSSNSNSSNLANTANGTAQSSQVNSVNLLPQGVAVSFTYQDMPIHWQWALAPQPLPVTNNTLGSSNNDNNNNNTGNNN